MDLGNMSGVGGAGRIEGPQPAARIKPPASPALSPSSDQVSISPHARITSDALSLPAIRADRVEEVRNLIQAGRFENDARLGAALDGFLAENPDALDE